MPAAVGAAGSSDDERLVSGEAVELDVRVARLGSRALALLLDIVVQVMLLYMLMFAASIGLLLISGYVDEALVFAVMISILVIVLVGYPTHLDLATRAARIAWPDEELGLTGANADEERFQRIHWRWAFAAPWAHWRILRHRLRERDETFPLQEIFHLDEELALTPAHERARGFRHLAWVDFHERLGGPAWPALLLCAAFLARGLAHARRALAAPAGASAHARNATA